MAENENVGSMDTVSDCLDAGPMVSKMARLRNEFSSDKDASEFFEEYMNMKVRDLTKEILGSEPADNVLNMAIKDFCIWFDERIKEVYESDQENT